MSTYILMRSNKQSAPLSLEQLIANGFKPYDLIWIEGKSALWRYPSEISELQEYAPVVEEQPYDRFYKKKTDEQTDKKEQETAISSVNKVAATVSTNNAYENPHETVYQQYLPKNKDEQKVKKEQEPASIPVNKLAETVPANIVYEKPKEIVYEQYVPKKTVSVIMPKQPVPEKKQESAVRQESIAKKAEPVFTPVASQFVDEKTEEVETKYSQSLDEIKERYVKQLQQRKQNTAKKKFIMQMLKNAAVFIAIIGSGVLIGFVIKPKHSAKNSTVTIPTPNVSPVNNEVIAKEDLTAGTSSQNDNVNLPEAGKAAGNKSNEVAEDQSAATMLSITESKSSVDVKKKAKSETEDLLINEQPLSSAINTSNSERNKSTRSNSVENETKEKTIVTGKELAASVSVNANNYKLRDFGGFRNLELTVTNDSKFGLENVLVELQYLNINDQPLKVEHIRFQSIEPDGKMTVKVPDNKRGAKLSYRILKIDPSK